MRTLLALLIVLTMLALSGCQTAGSRSAGYPPAGSGGSSALYATAQKKDRAANQNVKSLR